MERNDSNSDSSSTAAANDSLLTSSPRSGRGGGDSKPVSSSVSAWARLSNGAASLTETPLIIGGESWPALSDSVKAPSKPNPDSSHKALLGDNSSSSLVLSPSQVTTPSPANFNADPNYKSMKRNGSNISASANVSANVGNAQQPGLQRHVGEAYSNSSYSRDHPQRSLQSRGASDHPQPLRNSFRSRNGGLRPRGDGYGGRRDHGRSNPDWNGRNFGGRDANVQPQRGVPRFMRHAPPPPPPLPAASYIMPRAFGNHFGYPEFPFYSFGLPSDALRVPHFYPGALVPFYAPVADPHLLSKILNQIDYYFSDENLVKDLFLREQMDEQGWVPIKLIAGFKRVSRLTDNIQVILYALRSSLIVEVQGDRVRRQNYWRRWIIPSAVMSPNVSSVQSYGNSSHDTLTENIHRMSLEEQAISQSNVMGQADAGSEVILGRSFSGDLNNKLQPSMNEETGPHSHPGDSSYSFPDRN